MQCDPKFLRKRGILLGWGFCHSRKGASCFFWAGYLTRREAIGTPGVIKKGPVGGPGMASASVAYAVASMWCAFLLLWGIWLVSKTGP